MPRNLTVKEGESATFTCELPCTHAAYWYVGDLYNSVPLPYVDTVPGLTYTRSITPAGGCEVGTYVDSITIEAMADLDRVAVQCAVSLIDCPIDETCSIVYSRFRTLRGWPYTVSLSLCVCVCVCVCVCLHVHTI